MNKTRKMRKNKIDDAISKADNYLNESLDYDIDDNYSLRRTLKSLRLSKNQITKAETLLKKHIVPRRKNVG